ncbi:MAG: methionine biosynthesis protein MetW [Actinomycetota bacterium]|nr:methionine biosynthesis protein MetW [Actinomycetota bacterium]
MRVDDRERGEKSKLLGGEELDKLIASIQETSPNGHQVRPFEDRDLRENLHLANMYHDKNLPGEPSSGRKVLGPVARFVKRIVRRAVSWYMTPALENQRLFNAYVARTINEMKRYLDYLEVNEDILGTTVHRDLAMLRAMLQNFNSYLQRQMLDFDEQLRELAGQKSSNLVCSAPLRYPNIEEELLTANQVLDIEQRLHGSLAQAKERARTYLKYLEGRRLVLSLGCGRGEILQLLGDDGVSARGVEKNPALVEYCRDCGLDVTRGDSLNFLESFEDASVEGVVLSRFVGYEPPARALEVFYMLNKKLVDKGILIVEAPSPFSIYAAAGYGIEGLGGVYPVHPDTLEALCVSSGFTKSALIWLDSPFAEEDGKCLSELNLDFSEAELDPREVDFFKQMNENICKLNQLLFHQCGYALVLKKTSSIS